MYAVVFMAQLRFRVKIQEHSPHMCTIVKSFTGYCVLTTFHILAVDDLFIATKRSNNIHIFLAVCVISLLHLVDSNIYNRLGTILHVICYEETRCEYSFFYLNTKQWIFNFRWTHMFVKSPYLLNQELQHQHIHVASKANECQQVHTRQL